jgi:hypothetical protein
VGRFLTKANTPSGEVPAPTCRAILRSIARADVVSLAFPRLQRTLVLDLRPDTGNQPAVFVTQMMFTAAQELAAIEAHRPGLATIERYERAIWGGSTRAFAEQGVLPAILNRVPADETQDAMAVFEELREAERTVATHGTRAKVPLEQIRAEGKAGRAVARAYVGHARTEERETEQSEPLTASR